MKKNCYSEAYADFTTARVPLHAGGSALVHCAMTAVGQGANDLILRVAREELGTDDVRLALMEEIQTDGGVIKNANFTDYLLPTILDVPPIATEIIENTHPEAPYGMKGVGEPSTVTTPAAGASGHHEPAADADPRFP